MIKKAPSSTFFCMFRTFLFSLALTALSLHAVQTSYDVGCGIGYRKDQMSFTMSQDGALLYKEKDRNLKAVMLDGYFHIKAMGVLFSGRADGGWTIEGKAHNMPVIGGNRSDFKERASGFFVDAEPCLGLIFDFTNRRGGVQIVPQGGYSVYYQQLKYGAPHPETYAISGGGSTACDLSHTRQIHEWWGPFVGGDLVFLLLTSWSFEGGYYYYFLHFKQTIDPFEQLTVPPSQFFIRSHIRGECSGGQGQKIHGKIAAQIAGNWRMNWRFDILIFSASDKKARDREEIQQVQPAPAFSSQKKSGTLSASWHSFSSLLEVEYFF
jgi:hypothetical protein